MLWLHKGTLISFSTSECSEAEKGKKRKTVGRSHCRGGTELKMMDHSHFLREYIRKRSSRSRSRNSPNFNPQKALHPPLQKCKRLRTANLLGEIYFKVASVPTPFDWPVRFSHRP